MSAARGRTCLLILFFFAGAGARAHAASFQREADGITVSLPSHERLSIQVRADNIVRVLRAPAGATPQGPAVTAVLPPGGNARRGGALAAFDTQWSVDEAEGNIVVSTPTLRVQIDTSTGRVVFQDTQNRTILAETAGGATLEPSTVQGAQTFHIRQQWDPPAGEALYGLGQHQLGFLDLKRRDLDLWQHNTEVAVPFLVSSKGYGILWDNPSYTRFGALRTPEPIPGCVYTPDGHGGGQWNGTITPATTGLYTIRPRFTNQFDLWLDGKQLIHRWRQDWLPGVEEVPVMLRAGQPYRLHAVWTKDSDRGEAALLWKTPAAETTTSLWSQVGTAIDYYFVYGPALDRVVAGYRELTGPAPLPPIWAFGLWQSRQRYKTQQELLNALAGFRSRGIPIDTIVLDWFYWPEDAWGSHTFDPARFPDPAGMVREVHDKYHARIMISVWPKFYPGTANFNELNAAGALYQPNLREGLRDWLGHPYTFYDAFNPAGRTLYWNQIERTLYPLGIDAWWLDASEPDLLPQPALEGTITHMNPTALGPASRVLNAYPLLQTEAVAHGQLEAAPDRRVFILTRSAYAGQQRNAAATWSGDITATWTALRRQVEAGLGLSISGIPYWSMDTGGFAVPGRFAARPPKPADAEEWRELNARWFEFATFVPLLRVHGEYPFREMWQFGGESSPTYRAELTFDRLRYRMLPYLYSLAAKVTREGGTLMRPLAMDFPGDARALRLTDEYLFGPSLLVSPVAEYRARSRSVYLPAGAGWYDFWTGARMAGGKAVTLPAPFDRIPVAVRAGSLLPLGPERHYTTERTNDPVVLYVYTGADGKFDLYEDDGLTNGYRHGASTTIPLAWDEARRQLTIGPTRGAFPGMLTRRTFEVVLVSPTRPVGFSFDPLPDRRLSYDGRAVSVALP